MSDYGPSDCNGMLTTVLRTNMIVTSTICGTFFAILLDFLWISKKIVIIYSASKTPVSNIRLTVPSRKWNAHPRTLILQRWKAGYTCRVRHQACLDVKRVICKWLRNGETSLRGLGEGGRGREEETALNPQASLPAQKNFVWRGLEASRS